MTPEIKKAIKGYCEEMSNSMLRAEAERDLQKEATKAVAEEHELDKGILKKMARAYHRSNFVTQRQDTELFFTMYEELFGDGSAA